MKITILTAMLILAPAAAFAQKWEVGGDGGAGLLNTVNVTGAPGSATAGFAPGFVAGGFVGENLYRHVSGEIHYEFMQSNLRLTSGGQTAQFNGVAHAIHYDVAYHTGTSESNARFFVALGGGIKTFVGDGTEAAVQPLSQYGYFTKTKSVKPMGTVSVGFTAHISHNLSLRGEIRGMTSPFPEAVLTPPAGVKYGTMLTEIVPMVSIVYGK
jgi:hypothetical protein